ncbi:hypothetical protein N9995_00230, partial [bacterium]|nr:hypothetical protein [bacterium]
MCGQVDESKLLNKVKKTDKRERPKYDLRYRQKINSDDALGSRFCFGGFRSHPDRTRPCRTHVELEYLRSVSLACMS